MAPASYIFIFPYLPIVLNPGCSLKSPRKLFKNTRAQALPIRGSNSVVLGGREAQAIAPQMIQMCRQVWDPLLELDQTLPPTHYHTQMRKNVAGQMPDAQAEKLEARLDAGILEWGSPGSSQGRCGYIYQFPDLPLLISHPSSHPPAEDWVGGGTRASSCLIWGDFSWWGEADFWLQSSSSLPAGAGAARVNAGAGIPAAGSCSHVISLTAANLLMCCICACMSTCKHALSSRKIRQRTHDVTILTRLQDTP